MEQLNNSELQHSPASKRRGIISVHQSKSWERQVMGVSCGSLSIGTPQPWPSEPWEPGLRARGKNLFIRVFPPLRCTDVSPTELLLP